MKRSGWIGQDDTLYSNTKVGDGIILKCSEVCCNFKNCQDLNLTSTQLFWFQVKWKSAFVKVTPQIFVGNLVINTHSFNSDMQSKPKH